MGIDYEAMVRQVILELQQRLDDPPTFRELAAACYLSPYHFHRIFRAITGESPAELSRRLRLERGAWQARNTADPITTIAFASGYATHEAFTKAFQAGFGLSPSAFRIAGRNCPGIRAPNGVHYHPAGVARFHLPKTSGVPMQVEVVELPTTRLAAVRHRGPYFQIGSAFGTLEQHIAKLGLPKEPETLLVAVYYDDADSKPAAELESVAAISVADDADIGELEETSLPAGKYLRAQFVGHYSGLPAAWQRLYAEVIPTSGHTLRDGVCFEAYLSDHATTAPDDLRTDLYVPIA
ncbi:AraC family transcriptional regulator [Flindersiella endophytica]